MSNIAVVTDSVACIPADLVNKYNIHVAPVHIIWDGVKYQDGVTLSPKEFYTRLRTSKTLPTTSSAIQGEFIQIFESLRQKVDGIVTIVLTSALGAAYSAANNAKEMVEDVRIEVIDTHTAMMAQGFSVLAAAKVAADGGTMEDVAKAVREVVPKVHLIWTMDTLDYMRRGGRVSLPQAILASWLNVKPIVAIVEGKVAPVAKVRKRPKSIEKVLELAEQEISGKKGPLHMAVMHGDVPEEVEQLKQRVEERFQCSELIVSEISPVVGTHTGPETLGLAFYNG